MKLTSLLLVFLFIFSLQTRAQNTSKDITVQASVTVTKSPPTITIKWPALSKDITAYNIYRKNKDDINWGTAKASLKATDTLWKDTDVKLGMEYEYNIEKVNGLTLVGVTYLLSSIEKPVIHSRGNVLVVVERNLALAVKPELANYMKDIAADGWKVLTLQVNSTDSVKAVKREIMKMDKSSGGIRALLILGHVPVPYSGNFGQDNIFNYPPDGHKPDHNGCWPTDAYYAIDFNDWTDENETTDKVTRTQNQNLPGDGKFDNVIFPGTVKYYTGRVDLSNMSKFTKSEIELTKQYFQKAHDFRYAITKTVEKGVIEENFAASAGFFASTGWRNFSVMFGPKNIIEADYLNTCRKENILFGYGAGAGSYTSCGGVATTDSFTKTKGAVFNMLFGSYFGDWDNANNMLRAPLCATENGLTNAWAGRPWWQNHAMALGDPIGYSTMVTQNNLTTYQGYVFNNSVTIGLMGDPTLRLHMVAPPTNVMAVADGNNTKVNVTWNASTESGVLGYYIYRSGNELSNNVPLNSTPITDTKFTDNSPYQGNNYYLVKTVKLTTSASGSYFNLSHGAPAYIGGITGGPASVNPIANQTINVYPNPAHHSVTLQLGAYSNSEMVTIFNSQGQLVKSTVTTFNRDFISEPIMINDLANGLYFIKAANTSTLFIKQ